MALIDVQEQVRAAIYDIFRCQFVAFGRVAINFAAAAGLGGGSQVVDGTFAGALLGDYVMMGPEAAWEAFVGLGVPQVSAANTVTFGWENGVAAATDPAANTCRVTVLRPM